MKNQKGFAWLPLLVGLVVILGLSGGAYFVMHQHKAKSTDNSLTPAVNNSTPSQQNIYTNTQYGFMVTYPSDVTYTLSNPDRFDNGSVTFSVGSNYGSGRLTIGFPLPLSSCRIPKTDASHTAPTDLHTKIIGGITFSIFTNTSAPPAESYKQIIFQGMHNGDCYFFTEDILGGSVLSSTQIQAKLDTLVQSFHFTNSAPINQVGGDSLHSDWLLPTPTTGKAPLTVSFTPAFLGMGDHWVEYGDGTHTDTSCAQYQTDTDRCLKMNILTHTYNTPGVYGVMYKEDGKTVAAISIVVTK